MTEKEAMDLLNSIDDDLMDEKIDELFNQKGETIDMESIKGKAIEKLNESNTAKRRFRIKTAIAAAVAATLVISAVYADEISSAIQSFFNKSTVYSTVVDGDAYYLPEKIQLNDELALLIASVSDGRLEMTMKFDSAVSDKRIEGLDISVVAMNDKNVRYMVGGYMADDDGEFTLSFFNDTEKNYNISPFKDFSLTVEGKTYDISLTKAESVKVDGNLVLGTSEAVIIPESTEDGADEAIAVSMPLIANVAAIATEKDGATNIQIIASLDDPDLKLRGIGVLDFEEFWHVFENKGTSIISGGNSGITKPIFAYDQSGNSYELKEPANATGRPITVFETDAAPGTELTVKLPAINVGYEKEVDRFNLTIPQEGELVLDHELDFIIQKAVAKSVKRTSENTAIITFELNTGADKSVFISDINGHSKDVMKGEAKINGNTATMTITFDPDVEEAEFIFMWPSYIIKGDWSIELGAK